MKLGIFGILALLLLALMIAPCTNRTTDQEPIVSNTPAICSGGLVDPLEAWSEASYIVWAYNSTYYAARNMSTNMVESLSANATSIINNAVGNASLVKGDVFLVSGDYYIYNNTILIASNVRFHGEGKGTIIHGGIWCENFLLQNVQNVTMDNFVLIQGGHPNYTDDAATIYENGIKGKYSSNIEVFNVEVYYGNNNGMRFNSCHDVKVHDCFFYRCGHSDLSFANDTYNFEAYNNLCDQSGEQAIIVKNQDSDGSGTASYAGQVHDNQVRNASQDGIVINGCHDIIVSNNIVNRTTNVAGQADSAVGIIVGAEGSVPSFRIQIVNNIVVDPNDNAINLSGTSCLCSDISILYNTIQGTARSSNGIYVSDNFFNTTVNGNKINDIPSYGIISVSNFTTISYNQIYRCGNTGIGLGTAAMWYPIVDGNTVINCSAGIAGYPCNGTIKVNTVWFCPQALGLYGASQYTYCIANDLRQCATVFYNTGTGNANNCYVDNSGYHA